MASHIPSTTRDVPLVEAAQMANLEAIASLIQQTITVSQPDFFPSNVVQSVVQKFWETATAATQSSSCVMMNGHDSRWSHQGLVINHTETAVPTSSMWQLRSAPNSAYRCSPIGRLLNRQQAVSGAIAMLQARNVVAFSGINGTGKTALLRALCHHPQVTPHFANGIFYLRGYDRPLADIWQSVFDGLYQAHSAKPLESHTVVKPSPAEMQRLLAQQSVCIVLDELMGEEEQCAELIRWSQLSTRVPLMVAMSGHGGNLSQLTNGQHLPIHGLPLQDAIVLLEEELGRSLQVNEGQNAQFLCEQIAGHPRQIVQCAALVRQQHPLAELVHHLRRGTTIDAILLKTISALPDPERRIVAILATLGGMPLHHNHLPTLMNLSRQVSSVDEPLQTLIQYGIVVDDNLYYRLAHNLIEPIQRSWNLDPWANQIVGYFTAWLNQLSATALTVAETVMPIQANSDTLWSILRLAVRQQQWSAVLSMGTAMEQGLWLGKQWGRWQQVLLLQWLAARSLQNKAAEATILHQLGSRALCLGDRITAQTYLTQAFHYRRELGDTDAAAITQQNLMTLQTQRTVLQNTPAFDPFMPSNRPNPQLGPRSHRSPVEDSQLPHDSQLAGAAIGPQSSSTSGDQESSAASNPPPPTENTAILTSGSWFSWPSLAMVTGAIATLGLGFFLLRQQSFEYGLRRQYTFPPQRTSVKSEPYFFTITNTTSGPLPIDVAFGQGDEQDFSLVSNDCIRQPLAPEEQCSLVATFTPQNDGPRLATFAVNIGREDEPRTITLRGVGADVEAELNPNAMTFGQQIVAEPSQSQTIKFRNKGSVAFMVRETLFRENADDVFTLEKDTCSQQVLRPRDSCSLTFVFAPTDQTAYQSVLEVVDDTGREVWSVALTGIGIQIPTPTPVPIPVPVAVRPSIRTVPAPSVSPPPTPASSLQISPKAIAFGDQPLNTAVNRTITVTNTSSQDITLDESILSKSPMFTRTRDTCSNIELPPGGSCEIDLGFQVGAVGQYAASLIIGGSGEPLHRITLAGNGVAPTEVPPNDMGTATVTPPVIHAFNANPTELQPTDNTRLCYEITHATQAYIVDETTGQQIDLPTASAGCITQTPGRSTTYTLVAANQENQEVRNVLDIVVGGAGQPSPSAQPDQSPPTVPLAIAPTGGNTVYCTTTASLEWSAATDNGSPISYMVTLQRRETSSKVDVEASTPEAWVNLTTTTTSQTRLDLSGLIAPPFTYRWQVKAIDAAGNVSQPSDWAQFWCIAP